MRTARRFKFNCPHCKKENAPLCQFCGEPYVFDPVNKPGEKRVARRIKFPESTWEKIMRRAQATPGVGNAQEFIRLAVHDALAGPPHRLVGSS